MIVSSVQRKFCLMLIVLIIFQCNVLAQKIDKSKLDKAAQRSDYAAEVLTTTLNLRGDTIPLELLTKAKAVGVFPDFDRISFVMPKTRLSYGVISSRLQNGWSSPAYYGFGFIELENLRAKGSKKPDMIVLFMNDNAVERFQKGRVVLKDEMAGVAGPVGGLTPKIKDEISAANVIVYTIIDGKVSGLTVNAKSSEGGIINPDNNINEAIYGSKAQDVLSGKASINSSVLDSVSGYSNALTNLLNQK